MSAKSAKKPAPVAPKSAIKVEAAPATKKPVGHAPAATHAAAASRVANKTAPQRAVAVPANAHKAASQRLSAPVAAAQQSAAPKDVAEKAAAHVKFSPCKRSRSISATVLRPTSSRLSCPRCRPHRRIEEQEIAGMSLGFFVITFDKEKLTLRVPTGNLASVGMRQLADDSLVKKAMETLERPRALKRAM